MALSDLDENHFAKVLRYKQSRPTTPKDTTEANDIAPTLPKSTNTQNAQDRVSEETTSPASTRVICTKTGDTIATKLHNQQKWLSTEEISQIIVKYQNGRTTYELAAEYGCNRKAISHNLKKHGIQPYKDKVSAKLDTEQVLALYANMHTVAQIAEQLHVSPSTIQRILWKNGVTLRSRWEY